MNKERVINFRALFAGIFMMLLLIMISGRDIYAANTRETDVTTPAAGNVLVTIRGNFYTLPTSTILDRINEIRREACQEGIIDPKTEKPLTPGDYKPLKWSADLEWISQTRAAEATVLRGHTRTNGTDCFTCKHNGEQSWAENLAWNWDGIKTGIEQWYSEKQDWINKCAGKAHGQTGHYESLISTRYNYVALGCFRLSSGGWYTVSQEFSHRTNLDESSVGVSGLYDQVIEIPESEKEGYEEFAQKNNKPVAVKKVTLDRKKVNLDIINNKTTQLVASVLPQDADDRTITWTSGNESIAIVDDNGLVTAVGVGKANITAKTSNGKKAVCKVTVSGPKQPKSIKITKVKDPIKKGQTIKLSAEIKPLTGIPEEYRKITWSLAKGNKGEAIIDPETGELTCLGIGDIKVQATTVNNKKATITIKGPKQVSSVKIKPSDKQVKVGKLAVGDKFSLTPTIKPTNAMDHSVTWRSDNEAVATVDANGDVNCVGVGKATIYATSVSNPNKSGKCKLTVKE